MSEDTRRILNAVIYALAAVLAILGTVGQPHDVLGWAGFVLTAFLTGYGKYSTETMLIAPNRKPWTDDERRARLGSPSPASGPSSGPPSGSSSGS